MPLHVIYEINQRSRVDVIVNLQICFPLNCQFHAPASGCTLASDLKASQLTLVVQLVAMSSSWDPDTFKVCKNSAPFLQVPALTALSLKDQLKLTAQRLGQLQDKKDSAAQITRRDIATLLQQNNVSLARLKAHKLIREDAAADLLEILEMYCGVLLQRFADLSSP